MRMKSDLSPCRQQALSVVRLLILISLLAAAVFAYSKFFSSSDAVDENAQYYEVVRGGFLVTIVEGGTLEAVNEISVRNEMKYTTKIVSIVSEGTYVKKGDPICELDVSDIEDRLDEHKLDVESADFAVKQATEDLKITRSQQDSLIRAAQLRVEFANTDMEKYVDGDWPQTKRDAESSILTAKEKLAIDKDSLDWSIKLAAEGFETDKKVEMDKYTFLQSEVRLKQDEENLRLLIKYDHPKLLRQFEAGLEEATQDLKRVKSQATSKMAQEDAELKTTQTRAELQRKKLLVYEEQIKLAKIFAPEDGMVVYPFVSFRSSSQTMIEEGATVRPRQELIKLPDVSQMKVTVKVHESHVNQVVAGMGAYVVLDALPDRRFNGHVQRVNLMPDQGSRFSNPNLKVYSTIILIDDELPDVKPGLSARAEIVVTNLTDVIRVPLQCVTTYKNQQVCYVKKGAEDMPVPVEVGLYNSRFIQITSGLNAGDRLMLSPPLSAEEIGLDKPLVKEDGELPPNREVATQSPANGRAEQGRGGKQGQGKGGERRGGGERGGGRKIPADLLKRFDTNGNGEIDEDERGALVEHYKKQRPQKDGS